MAPPGRSRCSVFTMAEEDQQNISVKRELATDLSLPHGRGLRHAPMSDFFQLAVDSSTLIELLSHDVESVFAHTTQVEFFARVSKSTVSRMPSSFDTRLAQFCIDLHSPWDNESSGVTDQLGALGQICARGPHPAF
jgi:hypothetical protein